MLVDRIVKSRFDSLEFKRENGYRHPPLYIVTLAFRRKKRRASRELCREHPCTDIELIEENLIQIHGYVSILCVLMLCS
jgi:hypothetical protein